MAMATSFTPPSAQLEDASRKRRRFAVKFAVLLMLYVCQGLPFGFQTKALKVYLRQRGTSLAQLGYLGFLSAPWMMKPLWAPFVDVHKLPGVGRRKSWLVPFLILMAIAMIAAAHTCTLIEGKTNASNHDLVPLLVFIALLNFLAATSDIAADGLAVDVLSDDELGWGNTAQIVGYKSGILTGGGVLVLFVDFLSWSGVLLVMAKIVFATLIAIIMFNEEANYKPAVAHGTELMADESGLQHLPNSRSSSSKMDQDSKFEKSGAPATASNLGETIGLVWRQITRPGSIWVVLFVVLYKNGESLVDSMFVPFLVDAGFTTEEIGMWTGVLGMGASISGSLLGGWLANKKKYMIPIMIGVSTARCLPLSLKALSTLHPENRVLVVTGILSESFSGGVMSTVLFAFMMSTVTDRSVGGTHFTVLATLEVFGKAVPGFISGVIAEKIGYFGLFSVGVGLTALVQIVLYPLRSIDMSESKAA